MDQWLIRTSDNCLAGPFRKDQVCQMIEEGKLSLEDEVCPANGYWVYLHEGEEIYQLLGVRVPKRGTGEEITETQLTENAQEEDDTDTEIHPSESLDGSLTETSEKALSGKPDDTTRVLVSTKSKAPTPVRVLPAREPAPPISKKNPAPRVHVAGASQRDSIPLWQGILWLVLGIIVVIVMALASMMKH